MKRIVILALSLGLTIAAQAVPITEYFEYGTSSASLVGLTTSDTSGWGANGWSGSANPLYNVSTQSGGATPTELKTNLSLAVSGYVNDSQGGVLIGGWNAGVVTRSLAAAQSGDVWLGVLVDSTFWGAGNAGNHGYVLINGDSSDWFGLYSPLAVMAVVENGTETNNSVIGGSATQLLVAKMATDASGGNDELTVWFIRDGADLSDQDVAALDAAATWKYETATAQDIWGSSISSVGLEIKSVRDPLNPANGQNRFTYIDNLRLSYGGLTEDAHVFEVLSGIPEPGSALALGVLAVLLGRRSQ
jgi:hypothetical protein